MAQSSILLLLGSTCVPEKCVADSDNASRRPLRPRVVSPCPSQLTSRIIKVVTASFPISRTVARYADFSTSDMSGAAGNAIQAVKQFTTTGNASRISIVKEISIGMALGLGAGMVWKTWHWNEKRKISEYYESLEQIQKEEAANKA